MYKDRRVVVMAAWNPQATFFTGLADTGASIPIRKLGKRVSWQVWDSAHMVVAANRIELEYGESTAKMINHLLKASRVISGHSLMSLTP